MKRCFPQDDHDPLFVAYHDHEWGEKLNLDEAHLYEMMVLQVFQLGLSSQLILHKRADFRRAFANFDVDKGASFNDADCERRLHDPKIIRNHRKINAAINNARVLSVMHRQQKMFADILTALIPQPVMHHPLVLTDIPNKDALSTKVAKELHRNDFKFMGSVTTYSFLQSVRLINNHLECCPFKY